MAKKAAKKPSGSSSSKTPSPSKKPAKAAAPSSAPRSPRPSPAAAAKAEPPKPANYGGVIEHNVSLERLHTDPANARRHPERNMQTIMASLRQYGQVEPLVARLEDGQVIGGNGRYEAMRLLGWTACTVTWVDKSAIEAMGLGITLNRSGEQAEWDLDVLDRLTVRLEDAGVDLVDVGFTEAELDGLLEVGDGEGSADAGEVEEGEVPEPPAEPTSKPGDVWLLGQHRLMCGDSADAEAVARLMDGRLADLVFTDPPYNIAEQGMPVASGIRPSYKRLGDSAWDKGFDFFKVAPNILASMAPDSSVYVCTSSHLAGDTWQWMDTWSSHTSYCVWRKANPMPSLHKRHYTWCTELVCYATRGKHTFNFPDEGHTLNVWDIEKNRSNDLHPTMKPVAVPAHAIRHSSAPGHLVLDLFGGAGSTLLACEQLGRVNYSMEIDPRYVDVIRARWEQQTGKTAVLQSATTGAAKAAR